MNGGRGRQLLVITLMIAIAPQLYAAPKQFRGMWSGKIVADKPLIMKRANTPEYTKLLAYAIHRLETSTVSITFQAGHNCVWNFDDGYPPDREELRGTWAPSAQGIDMWLPYHPLIQLLLSGGKLIGPFHAIPGLKTVFSQDLTSGSHGHVAATRRSP